MAIEVVACLAARKREQPRGATTAPPMQIAPDQIGRRSCYRADRVSSPANHPFAAPRLPLRLVSHV
jgi:hypothetical protein